MSLHPTVRLAISYCLKMNTFLPKPKGSFLIQIMVHQFNKIDHVAMIIRDKKYGILMFEANSFSGVSLNPWNCMIKYGWFKYIKR